MKIKHWFIPTKQNKFHPHILRTTGMVVILIVLAIIPPLYNVISVGQTQVLGYAIDVNVTDVFTISNQERTNAGLAPLSANSALASAATAKANHMFANDYWAHVAPDGTTPWSFIAASGYDYKTAGENLAKGFSTSSGVVAGWMGSTTHRANVLNADYKDVGYAVVNGVLLGSETTLVVAMYGLQPTQAVATTAPVTTPSQPAATTQTTNQPETSTSNSQTTPTAQEPVVVSDVKQEPVATTQPESKKITVDQTNPTTTDTSKIIAKGDVAGTFITVPIRAYNSLNWGQKASLLIASTMILLFVMKHTMIWRQQKRGLHNIWLRAHPIGQAIVLGVSIIVIIGNSIGVVL